MKPENVPKINNKTAAGPVLLPGNDQGQQPNEATHEGRQLSQEYLDRPIHSSGSLPDLDPEQQEHFDAVMDGEKLSLLTGVPGSGKTRVMVTLQYELAQAGVLVFCLFPSHASKIVSREQLKDKYPGTRSVNSDISELEIRVGGRDGGLIVYNTIHSILGLRPDRSQNVTGDVMEQQFKATADSMAKSFKSVMLHAADAEEIAVFIDEVSMIPDDFFRELINFFKLSGLLDRMSFHLSGDFDQLRPVQGNMADDLLKGSFSGGKVSHLVKNHRADGRNIAEVAKEIQATGRLPDSVDDYPEVEFITDGQEFRRLYASSIYSSFDTVALAWRNKAVGEYADLAAKVRAENDPIHLDAVLITGQPVFEKRTDSEQADMMFFTGERVQVITDYGDVTLSRPWHNETAELRSVEIQGVQTAVKTEILGVMASRADSFKRYLEEQRDICIAANEWFKGLLQPGSNLHYAIEELECKDQALFMLLNSKELGGIIRYYYREFGARTAAKKARGLLWAREFFAERDSITTLRSVDAQTCHTAQGCGRDHVFLDAVDIQKSRDQDTRKRLLYVGASRAKKTLTVLVKRGGKHE